MLALTRPERRAALVVVFLLLFGAASDLWRAHHPRFKAMRAPIASTRDARGAGDVTATPGAAPPDSGAGVADRTSASRGRMVTGPIDLNHAGPIELDGLPGIGPVLAARILEQRMRHGPFREVDELLAVRGIGPRLLERLRPHVTVTSEIP